MIADLSDVLAVGELQLLSSRHELQWGTQFVHLSPQEQTLLARFLAAPRELLDTALLKNTLGVSSARYSSYLYMVISRLRRKLAQLQYPGEIAVSCGRGYYFIPAAAPPPSFAPTPPDFSQSQHSPPLRVDPSGCALWGGRRPVPLSPTEAAVLRRLLQAPGQSVALADFLQAWPAGSHSVKPNTVRVFIAAVRRKLRAATSGWRIRHLPWRGYILEPDPDPDAATPAAGCAASGDDGDNSSAGTTEGE